MHVAIVAGDDLNWYGRIEPKFNIYKFSLETDITYMYPGEKIIATWDQETRYGQSAVPGNYTVTSLEYFRGVNATFSIVNASQHP